MEKYCDCHKKHTDNIESMRITLRDYHTETRSDFLLLWEAVKQKMPINWLIVIIPVILAWVTFQVMIYDSIKSVETKVAVIEVQIGSYLEDNHEGKIDRNPP